MAKDRELAEKIVERLPGFQDEGGLLRGLHIELVLHDRDRHSDDRRVRLLTGMWSGLEREVFLGELCGHRGVVRFRPHHFDVMLFTGFVVRDGCGGYELLTILRHERCSLKISADGQIRTRSIQPLNEQWYRISPARWGELQPWIEEYLNQD